MNNPQPLQDLAEAAKLREDLKTRPDESTLEDYDRVPVDQFGSYVLRNLGWSEGSAIGRTNAQVFEPVVLKRRAGSRRGLGATPTDDELPPHSKRHKTEEEMRKERKEEKEKMEKERREKEKQRQEAERIEKQNKAKVAAQHAWLHPGIIVRIVDKKLGKGKFYLKKAIILDVFNKEECSVQLVDDAKTMLDVNSTMLETVIPRDEGEYVLVVLGNDRGMKGKFLEKSKGKSGDSMAVVQLEETLAVVEYQLEHISQIYRDYQL